MQTEVQNSIKIATKAKECADTQKKSKIETGDMPSFANVAGKSCFNARSVCLVMMSLVVMIPMLHAKQSI